MESFRLNRVTKNIKLGAIHYRAYKVGEIPSSFGFIHDAVNDGDGTKKWFNYKGFTYLKDERSREARQ
jgi:hypothetical protein